MMHGGGGEQHRDRDARGANLTVRENDDVDAVAHGLFDARPKRVERRFHSLRARFRRIADVEGIRLEIGIDVRDLADFFHILVGQNRLMDFKALSRRVAFEVEQVGARADDRDEAHHQFLADRIDRRVGDLREVLLEISVQHLRLVGEHRDRRVVAHRADGFLAGGAHRRHQHLQVFLCVAEGLLAIQKGQVRDRRMRLYRRQLFELNLRILQPLLVGMEFREFRLDLLVRHQPALLEIDQQHLARLQPPLRTMSFSSIGSTPISDAIRMRSSRVTR